MLRWNLLRNWNPWAPESAIHAPGKRSGDAMQAKDVTKANEYVHELDSILSAVSIVGILSHQLAQSKDRTRKIYAALVNVTTAAATLMGHLDNIKRSGITELHAAKMCLLSNCLEEVFSDDVLGLVDEHKTWEPAHRRLRAVIASNTQEWYTDAKRYAPRLNSLRELGHILRQLKGLSVRQGLSSGLLRRLACVTIYGQNCSVVT
ncbi:hypothetical protein K4F52_009877 [Lecanicillium sp. MT-2017a]|nr:hypothetical protein K4F52_009877 [Lecanicillium sp. MT-2017a]